MFSAIARKELLVSLETDSATDREISLLIHRISVGLPRRFLFALVGQRADESELKGSEFAPRNDNPFFPV